MQPLHPYPHTVVALSALAQESRLAIFRRLVRAGADGLAAGDIARELGLRPNTLSSHLAILSHAGLATSRRAGRSVYYAANYAAMRALLSFLVADCCAGQAEICAELVEFAAPICAETTSARSSGRT